MRKFWCVVMAGVLCAAGAAADAKVRRCVANGPMYPEKMDDIVKALNRFYDAATWTPPV